MAVIKNKTTPEGKRFWEHIESVAKQVVGWAGKPRFAEDVVEKKDVAYRDFGPLSCAGCGAMVILRKYLPDEMIEQLHVCPVLNGDHVAPAKPRTPNEKLVGKMERYYDALDGTAIHAELQGASPGLTAVNRVIEVIKRKAELGG